MGRVNDATPLRLTVVPKAQPDGATLTGSALKEFVVESVRERAAVDDLERADIRQFLAEVERLDDPFDRGADPVHVTGSGFVVGPRGIVLLRHLKIDLWLQPGGHVDQGETPWNAARREVIEETGMHVTFAGDAPELVHVSVHDVPGGHTHLDLRYLFDGGDADPSPPVGESQDVHWFDWPDAIAIAEPSLSGILRHLRDRLS
jgi:8-oxo-dGTP pyrophosphatase MutT (NUDIX family)